MGEHPLNGGTINTPPTHGSEPRPIGPVLKRTKCVSVNLQSGIGVPSDPRDRLFPTENEGKLTGNYEWDWVTETGEEIRLGRLDRSSETTVNLQQFPWYAPGAIYMILTRGVAGEIRMSYHNPLDKPTTVDMRYSKIIALEPVVGSSEDLQKGINHQNGVVEFDTTKQSQLATLLTSEDFEHSSTLLQKLRRINGIITRGVNSIRLHTIEDPALLLSAQVPTQEPPQRIIGSPRQGVQMYSALDRQHYSVTENEGGILVRPTKYYIDRGVVVDEDLPVIQSTTDIAMLTKGVFLGADGQAPIVLDLENDGALRQDIEDFHRDIQRFIADSEVANRTIGIFTREEIVLGAIFNAAQRNTRFITDVEGTDRFEQEYLASHLGARGILLGNYTSVVCRQLALRVAVFAAEAKKMGYFEGKPVEISVKRSNLAMRGGHAFTEVTIGQEPYILDPGMGKHVEQLRDVRDPVRRGFYTAQHPEPYDPTQFYAHRSDI